MRVAVVGLTHLGICMAIASHDAGFSVIAWDTDAQRIADAREARFDPAEPGVVDFLRHAHEGFQITDDPDELRHADVVLIAIDTRLLDDGSNDESEVVDLLAACARIVPGATPIVIASQVRPGFTRAHAHVHPTLCYFMETLIFGRGLARARHPERFIIGLPDAARTSVGSGNDDDTRSRAHDLIDMPEALRAYLEAWPCPIHVMSYESAELTKLSANVVLAASITAANSLAELAAALGASWPDIEAALRDDSRIGHRAYLSAGMGIGGANLGRDIEGIKAMADRHGLDATLAGTMLAHSAYMRGWLIRAIARLRADRPIVSLTILGLSYKPGTTSTRGSAGLECARVFAPVLPVTVYDPAAVCSPADGPLRLAGSVGEALSEADIVVVATPWPQFQEPVQMALRSDANLTVVDPYRLIERDRAQVGRLIQLGVAND